MGISVQPRSDVSYLFSGMGTGINSTSSMSSLFSDYASIKNGSYGKLLKAYYNEAAGGALKSAVRDSVGNRKNAVTGMTSEESKAYTRVEKDSDALKSAADGLLGKSLFQKKDITEKDGNGAESTTRDYDKNSIYQAVNGFVNSYNALMTSAEDTEDATLQRRVESLGNKTLGSSKALKAVGITIGEDGRLSLDKDTFMKSDMIRVKSLFNENGSYGYQVSAQASLISYAADSAVEKGSAYSVGGTYSSTFHTGNLFNGYF
ncbi:MAG: hypothetical protein ACI4HQ_00570 [Acetatifactor sp.]